MHAPVHAQQAAAHVRAMMASSSISSISLSATTSRWMPVSTAWSVEHQTRHMLSFRLLNDMDMQPAVQCISAASACNHPTAGTCRTQHFKWPTLYFGQEVVGELPLQDGAQV